jgi:sortase A
VGIIAASVAVWAVSTAAVGEGEAPPGHFWDAPVQAVPADFVAGTVADPSTTVAPPLPPDTTLTPPVTEASGAPAASVVPRAPDDPGVRVSAASLPTSSPGVPVIGRIVVPRLGLDTTMYDGAELRQIDRGPSHYPGTAMPGRKGNTVIAGHRVTHTAPFRGLGELQPGDTATFAMPYGTFTYEYVYTDVVRPEAGRQVVAQGTGYTATLFACHPPGSEAYRIVTHWRLISDAATGADPNPPTFDANGGGGPGGGSSTPATTPTTAPHYGTGSGGGAGYFGKPTTTTTRPPQGYTQVTEPERLTLPSR